MTRKEAIEKIKMILAECTEDEDAVCYVTFDDADALDMAIKVLEQEPILGKIKAEIGMYEADCRLQGGTDECEKCNSNIFGSIYRIIDKYKAESEDKE